jgi:capsular exopolysaccharide synthesis family protein
MGINETILSASGRKSDLVISSIFGKLKANIDFSFVGNEQRTLIVTSALPNEGKTAIAANTAVAMAASGKKTLLMDADMRNPTVHMLFNYVNARGLSDIISQSADWRPFIIKTSIANLYIITAGRKPVNASKFLTSERFKITLEDLAKNFDYVVLDTPPVLLVPDSQIISPLVDGVVLVIRSGSTPGNALTHASETLKRANANIIGAVLNDVKVKNGPYGYGYGYGYGANSKNAKRAVAHKPPKTDTSVGKPTKADTPAHKNDSKVREAKLIEKKD